MVLNSEVTVESEHLGKTLHRLGNSLNTLHVIRADSEHSCNPSF